MTWSRNRTAWMFTLSGINVAGGQTKWVFRSSYALQPRKRVPTVFKRIFEQWRAAESIARSGCNAWFPRKVSDCTLTEGFDILKDRNFVNIPFVENMKLLRPWLRRSLPYGLWRYFVGYLNIKGGGGGVRSTTMIAVDHDSTFNEICFCVTGGKAYDRVEYVARDLLVCPQTDRVLWSWWALTSLEMASCPKSLFH